MNEFCKVLKTEHPLICNEGVLSSITPDGKIKPLGFKCREWKMNMECRR